MDSEKEGEGFVIKDKRSSQLSEEEATEKGAAEETARKEQASQGAASQGSNAGPMGNFEIDFSTFVLSLTSSAFYHLGDMADPETGQKEVNLPAVKQTIDMLLMLKIKTKGNLTQEEHQLLEQLIYELQMKYVSKNK
ncbi:MAG: DUF1844 domain-containing protein [Candidatus Nitrohelix vancouverensis]|uniref:DUF1844 domain-containing protein n=1 Tax=Candidatus Nitrohelix vancouverensis TaxID=2705534 RepID=A0A7T0C4X4_9BACT|nr:MAG: DUF1844 domain-containing protein [Candidatus Nitrohelix vancouverensis]